MKPDTYSRILDYEVSRELKNSAIAALSARIADEERKPFPDQTVIDNLVQQQIRLGVEQELLPGPYV